MALWCDKYRPTALNRLDFHCDQAEHLKKLLANGDVPHLLFFGPSGSGKKTRAYAVLRELFGSGVEKLRLDHQQFETQSKRKFEQVVISSNYHLEVCPSDSGFYDRIVIQDLIKNMATSGTLTDKYSFKVVLITEADKLTREAQQGLRRTMEKYVASCRLILIAESSSRIIPPVKSRCLMLRVGAPTETEIINILKNTAKKEAVTLPPELSNKIANESDRNLRRAIMMMEAAVTRGNSDVVKPQWQLQIKSLAQTMLRSQSAEQLKIIREKFYELMSHLIPSDLVMREVIKELLPNVDQSMKPKIISAAAEFEHRMCLGAKPVIQFEAFAAKVMALYKCSMESVDFDDDINF